jgi:hypothetical protein
MAVGASRLAVLDRKAKASPAITAPTTATRAWDVITPTATPPPSAAETTVMNGRLRSSISAIAAGTASMQSEPLKPWSAPSPKGRVWKLPWASMKWRPEMPASPTIRSRYPGPQLANCSVLRLNCTKPTTPFTAATTIRSSRKARSRRLLCMVV